MRRDVETRKCGLSFMEWKYHKPDFEYEKRLTLSASTVAWAGHVFFAYDLVMNLRPRRIVELGTHSGQSFFSFCQADKDAGLGIELYAVDTWKGDEHSGFYESVRNELNETKKAYYDAQKITFLRMTFDEAVHAFNEESIDVLHIDGLHAYEAVKHDIETWLEKVSNDGIILLHDIIEKRDDFGVYRVWDELKERHATMEFHHSHGLGVLFRNPDTFEKVSGLREIWRNYYHVLADRELLRYRSQQKELDDADHSQWTRELLVSQVYYPGDKKDEAVYAENRLSARHLFPDEWRKVVFPIPKPGALKTKPLRFDPVSAVGVVTISAIRLVNQVTGNAVWTADSSNGFAGCRTEGTCLPVGDTQNLTLVSTGDNPMLFLPVIPELPDVPLNLEVWLKVSRDLGALHSIWDSQITKAELLVQQVNEKARLLEDAETVFREKEQGYQNQLEEKEKTIIEKARLLEDTETVFREKEQGYLRLLLKGNVEKHIMGLIPKNNLKKLDANGLKWESTNDDPHFYLVQFGKYPKGHVLIDFQMKLQNANYSPKLYWDLGEGFSENNSIRIPISKAGKIHYIAKLPKGIKLLRFDPTDSKGTFELVNRGPSIRKISWFERTYRMLRRIVPVLFSNKEKNIKTRKELDINPLALLTNLEKIYFAISDYRSYKFTRQQFSYDDWIATFDALTDSDRKTIKKDIEKMPQKPLISVIMPVFNTPEVFLRKTIDSVVNQIYPYWELCIADDASTEGHVKEVLQEYANREKRIKVTFREKNGHISAASNSALKLAVGDFVALLDHDDELAEKALYRVAVEINRHPDADIIYSDEDKVDEGGRRFDPHFKPDWNPELFFSQNYICHLTTLRRDLVDRSGGFREGFEGSQDYDLLLRCVSLTGHSKIRHIPEILYHWRAIQGSTALKENEKDYTVKAGIKALRAFFSKINPDILIESGGLPTTYRVRYPVPKSEPKVSLIIPTRNGLNVLSQCIESILAKTEYNNYEIIIVDNQSDDPKTISYLNEVHLKEKVRVIHYNQAFNFSAINNYAVKQAQGELIGLINNDVEVISSDWLKEMVSYAVRPDIGAVGAKLLYPDGRIQHAGVIVGLGGVAGHSHKFISRDDAGYYGRAILPQALSSVTAACLIVRKKLYEEVSGLDEKNLTVAFNDVDFCLKLREKGYRNVWTPYALLYHHESVSRGYEDTPEKQARFQREILFIKQKWGNALLYDPGYNSNLTLDREDFSIAHTSRVVPAWRHEGNRDGY